MPANDWSAKMSQDKEWFCDFPKMPKLTVLPWLVWAAIIVSVIWATKAYAEPVLKATVEDVSVFLWTDECALKGQIKNLPYKATWQEKGKTFQGCWGARPDIGVVIFYFEDKTMGLAPIQAFEKVAGA